MEKLKYMVFDASSLISMALTCTLGMLEKLKKDTNYIFCITPDVKYEVIDRAMNIPRFKYEGHRIQMLIENGTINLIGPENKKIKTATDALLKKFNHMFEINGKPLELVQRGEISMLALANYLGADAIAVDERTARLMIENPLALQDILGKKFHKKVDINKKIVHETQIMFSDLTVLRSVELMLAAHKKGHSIKQSKEVLSAMLTALKFSGCSVTSEEIFSYSEGEKW